MTKPKETTVKAWDRQKRESTPAWESFKCYRDMGLTRSVKRVCEELGRAPGTIATYSAKHSWVMRVTEYDAENDRQDQLWMKSERHKALSRHVRQAQSLQSKWIQRLQTLRPEDLSTADVIRYADIATRMEREALGLTKETANIINFNTNVDARVGALSPEDTRIRLQELQNELEERMTETAAITQREEDDRPSVIDKFNDYYSRTDTIDGEVIEEQGDGDPTQG